MDSPERAELSVRSRRNNEPQSDEPTVELSVKPVPVNKPPMRNRNLSVIEEEPVERARLPPPRRAADAQETSTIITESSLGTYKSKTTVRSSNAPFDWKKLKFLSIRSARTNPGSRSCYKSDSATNCGHGNRRQTIRKNDDNAENNQPKVSRLCSCFVRSRFFILAQ